MALVTPQQLENASADSNTISAVTNGDENTTVMSRLGRVFPTLAKTFADWGRSASTAVNSIRAFNYRGEWTPNTSYAVKDVVIVGNAPAVAYVAPASFVSGASFAEDMAAGKWVVHQGETELSLADPTTAARIGYMSQTVGRKLGEVASLQDYGGIDDSISDIHAALLDLLADHPVPCTIRLPFTDTGVYYLSSTSPISLTGYVFDPDPGVSVTTQNGDLLGQSGALCTRPLRLNVVAPASFQYQLSPYVNRSELEKTQFMSGGAIDQSRVLPLVLSTAGAHVVDLPWPFGDLVETGLPVTGSDNQLTLMPEAGSSKFRFVLMPAFGGEEICACSTPGSIYGGGFFAIFVRLNAGYHIFFQPPGGGSIGHAWTDGAGTTEQQDFAYKGLSTHSSYWPEKSLVQVRVHNSRSFSILYNGVEIKRVTDTASDVIEIGIGCGYNPDHCIVTLSNWTRLVNKPMSGKGPLSVVTVGDSRTDGAVQGSWTYAFLEAIENAQGIRIENFLNLAVSGEASGQQLARLQAADLTAYQGGVLIIPLCTNDIQGMVPVATTVSNIQQMIDIGKANSMTIIGAPPAMFYTQGQATAFGGSGQGSVNYDQGGPLRAALLRLFADNKVKPALGVLEDLGPILAEYLATPKDPMMRDNIHDSAYAARLIGYGTARAVMGALQPLASRSYDRQKIVDLPSIVQHQTDLFYMGLAGSEAAVEVAENDLVMIDGFVQLLMPLTVDQLGALIPVMNLPRHLWPGRSVRLTATATDAGGFPLNTSVFLFLDAAGALTVKFSDISQRGFYLDPIQYIRAYSGSRR